MQPPFTLAMWGVSKSLSIWSSKSDPPYRDPPYSPSGGWQFSHVPLTFVLLFWHLDERRFLLAFGYQFHPDCCHYFYPPLHWHWPLRGVSSRVNPNCSCPCRFFIWVDANCSYSWTSLICWKIFIKTVICIPISVLILFIFLDWFSARTSAKLPIMVACFAVNLSWMVEKHIVDFHQCFA